MRRGIWGSCKRASICSPTRPKPEPGPSPTVISEARFKHESQLYRV